MGIELAVVSDGLDWAIETVLESHGIHGLPVYANHVVFEGAEFHCEFPWYDPLTPLVGVCKPLIVRRYRQDGGRVIYIGDGRSDREAVAEAGREMRDQLFKERVAFERIWKAREAQIQRLMNSTAGIYGSMQGLVGSALSQISGLEIESETAGEQQKLGE